MKNRILILVGYGGVGKYLVNYLLKYYDYYVVVAGRNQEKGEAFTNSLKHGYENE